MYILMCNSISVTVAKFKLKVLSEKMAWVISTCKINDFASDSWQLFTVQLQKYYGL